MRLCKSLFLIALCGLALSYVQHASCGGGSAKPTAPELVAQVGHVDYLSAIAFASDGRTLYTGSRDGTAIRWELPSGKVLRAFRGHEAPLHCLVVSDDGKWLVTGGDDNLARLWDAKSGQLLRVFRGHTESVMCVALSRDGKQLLTGSSDQTARLWETDSGRTVATFRALHSPVASAALSGDGKRVVLANGQGMLSLWSTDGRLAAQVSAHAWRITGMALSKDGKSIVTASVDGTAKLWETNTLREVRTFKHASWVLSVAMSHDGHWVLTCTKGVVTGLWNAKSGDLVREIGLGPLELQFRPMAGTNLLPVAISRDSKLIATGGPDSSTRVWNRTTGKQLVVCEGHIIKANYAMTSEDGKKLLTRHGGVPHLWDITTGVPRQLTVNLREPGLGPIAASANLDTMVIAEHFRRCYVVDLRGNTPMEEAYIGEEGILATALSPDKKLLAAADRSLCVSDARTGALLRVFGTGEASDSAVRALAFAPDCKGLVSAGDNGIARLWNAETGKELKAFVGHSGAIWDIRVSKAGKNLFTAGRDGTARLWNLETGKQIRLYRGHTEGINSLSLNKAQDRLLTASSRDSSVRIWDVATGAELLKLHLRPSAILSASFTGAGERVAVICRQGPIDFYESTTGKHLCRLVVFGDNEWAVFDLAGRFTAPNGGNIRNLHWVLGEGTCELTQFKDRYYDAALLGKYMGLNKRSLREVGSEK